eukprot:1158551-Pelagomonas_calceolata.AAC.4
MAEAADIDPCAARVAAAAAAAAAAANATVGACVRFGLLCGQRHSQGICQASRLALAQHAHISEGSQRRQQLQAWEHRAMELIQGRQPHEKRACKLGPVQHTHISMGGRRMQQAQAQGYESTGAAAEDSVCTTSQRTR